MDVFFNNINNILLLLHSYNNYEQKKHTKQWYNDNWIFDGAILYTFIICNFYVKYRNFISSNYVCEILVT